ncbi:hypothetical protein [Yinghuangia sp. YIM S10712]|uniref:hypothetical protein n=1 Tax=Yinghuangia sp. YIM S10712 TaxID=3436930 RepID=UPI003F53DEDC
MPPWGTAPFDALQRAGVAHIFGASWPRLDAVDGLDGVTVVVGHWVASYPAGARLVLTLEAPSLESAEGAARLAVGELLGAAEEFAGWSVASCGVELHDQLAQESLAAADGPNAPPSDPEERRRRLRRKSRDADEAEPELDEDEDDGEAEAEAPASRLRALAGRLGRGFDAFVFSPAAGDGDVSYEEAELAAGAVVAAIDQLTDELFFDLVEGDRARARRVQGHGLRHQRPRPAI